MKGIGSFGESWLPVSWSDIAQDVQKKMIKVFGQKERYVIQIFMFPFLSK